jgi:hypothetical protein
LAGAQHQAGDAHPLGAASIGAFTGGRVDGSAAGILG